jgi:hypothetical protein
LSWQVHPVFAHVVVQSSELPQPSPMFPQYWSPFAVVQVSGTQPELGPALHCLSWQVHPVFVQVVPQFTVDPHPSPISPQYWSPFAVAQDRGTQLAVGPALHKLLWQVHPSLVQVAGQSSFDPQPSPISPQYSSPDAVVQVLGTQ